MSLAIQRYAVSVYCDGGCIGRNPSQHGGTWAFVVVDKFGNRIAESCGVKPKPSGLPYVENNLMEYIAAVRALEWLPKGWTGTLYTDSNNTIGRLFQGWTTNGVPEEWVDRALVALRTVGPITPVLLKGHPTQEDLARGYARVPVRGTSKHKQVPVSHHNVRCDELCNLQASYYMSGHLGSVLGADREDDNGQQAHPPVPQGPTEGQGASGRAQIRRAGPQPEDGVVQAHFEA